MDPGAVGDGRGMVLDGGGDHRREGQFWSEFGTSHCNQLGLCCVFVREPTELSFGVVSGINSGIHVLDGVHMPQGEGTVSRSFQHLCPIGLSGQNEVFFAQKCL